MERPFLQQSRRRKHKSDFFLSARAEGKLLKPKRLSCMAASQLLQMEESQTQVANFLIEQLLSNVFNSINQAKIVSQLCTKQLDDKVKLLDNFQIYNMQMMPQQLEHQICLQKQPTIQQKHKVVARKEKIQQNFSTNTNQMDSLVNQFNKTNSSNSKNKFFSKQKLLKITNTLAPNQSNKSIKSMKSNIGNSHSISSYRIPKRIEEQNENEKEKQRRQKEEIIKRLMRQYQSKLKEIRHICPEPLAYEYRSFFTQPESKEEQDLRTSFLHLREVRQTQQNLNKRNTYKKISSSMIVGQKNNKQNNARTTKLPTIYRTGSINKKQENISLFAQDQNGQVIKVKNQRIDTLTRQHSMTTHQNFHKIPRQTPLKEVSNIHKVNYEYLKNDKIKDQNTFLNQNASLVSTLCQSMDEQMMEKSLMQNFTQKKGVIIKRPTFTHRSSMSVELSAVKLPSIMMKRR